MRKQILFAACIAILAATTRLLPAAEKIVGGPFVVSDTGRAATIVWLVEAGESPLIASAFRVEAKTLTSLQPDMRYEYNIASEGDAGKGSFKTPPMGEEPYRFLVYGDNRTRHDVHRRVIAEVMKHGIPDFVLQTGDMVENGNDSSQWPVFFDIEKDLLRQTAFFPALGNHERNTHYFKDIFQLASTHYSFDWGNGHFAVIDSDLESVTPEVRNEFWAEESRWLEEDLQTHQKAGYRFVMAHHPPFTAVSYRQGNNPHMTALTTMFEKYHVSAGFFGHDHNYQHYLKNGIHYVTTGGGGAPLYDVNKPPDGITQKVVSIENFVNVAVNGKTAHLQAIAIDGRVLDEFDIASPVR